MGDPYLNSGESLIQTTDRISIDSVSYDLLLTNRRIILVDSTHAESESLQIPFAAIMSLKGGWNPDGEPIITITLFDPNETDTPHTLDLVFSQIAGEYRKEECDGWVIYLMDQIVLSRQESIRSSIPVEYQETCIQPSVRRWVAPDRIQPHAKIAVPRTVPVIESLTLVQPDSSPVTESRTVPVISSALQEATEQEVPDVPEDTTQQPETGILTPECIDDPGGAGNADPEQPVDQQETHGPKGPDTLSVTQSQELPEEVPEQEVTLMTMTSGNAPEPEMGPVPEPSAVISVLETEPEIPLVTEQYEPDNIAWPVIHAPQSEDTATLPPTGAVKPLSIPDSNILHETPRTPPPTPSPGSRRHTIFIAMTIFAVIAAIAGGVLLYSAYGGWDRTKTEIPVVTPTPTMTPVPTVPVFTIPKTGIWVKVESNSAFVGSVGSPGSLTMVGGSGTHVFHIQQSDGGIQVSFQKQEYTGEPMTVDVYNNGTLIAYRTITAPRGTIDMIVDPGNGAPFGVFVNRS